MARQRESHLTAAQLEIMDLFWERGELGVAQVWKLLEERRPIARNTVQTMLARLAEKGWLRVRAEGNAHYYRAARPRGFAVKSLLRSLLDSAFGGSASGLVAALLENRQLSGEEAQRLREIIDRSQQEES